MTYLVTDNCIKCKHTDCVQVCPVDCFYEGENFLVINPDECIDCGVCVPECPAEAIVADSDLQGEELIKWMDINTLYSQQWPVITEYKGPMEGWEQWDKVPNKFEEHFSEAPADQV